MQCSRSHHPGNCGFPEQCNRAPPNRHTMRRAVHNFWLGHGGLIPTLHIRAFRTWVPAHAPSRACRVSAVVYKTTNYFYKPHVCLAVTARVRRPIPHCQAVGTPRKIGDYLDASRQQSFPIQITRVHMWYCVYGCDFSYLGP